MALLRETNQFVNFVDLLSIKLGSGVSSLHEKFTIKKFFNWINTNPATDNESPLIGDIDEYFKQLDSNDYPSWLADTSLGGNEAMNSWPQYSEDDDIRYDNLMGRVYRKNIENNKQLLHLSFGLPHLNNLIGFYNSAILGRVRNQAAGRISENDPGYQNVTFLRTVTHNVVGFSKMVLQGMWNLAGGSDNEADAHIAKYYEIRPEMASYHKHVNTILIKLAIAMNIVEEVEKRIEPNSDSGYTGVDRFPAPFGETGLDIALIRSRRRKLIDKLNINNQNSIADQLKFNPESSTSSEQDNQKNATDYNLTKYEERKVALENVYYRGGGVPDSNGVPIYEVISDIVDIGEDALDSFLTVTGLRNWWGDLRTTGSDSISRGYEFIAFKVDSDINTSESFSNTTTTSSVSELLSGVADTVRDLYYSTNTENVAGNLSRNVGGIFQELGAQVSSEISAEAANSAAEIFFDGNRIVIPKIWADSEYSTSHSFNLTLRTPYGDPHSIFQDIYVPLACILAGTLPRATGLNSYTRPFFCRAYATGMTSIPLGLIDSLTIERGSEQFGFNKDFYPLSLNISFTIKDLTGSMPISSDMPPLRTSVEGLYQYFAKADSNLTDYLGTLGGITPYERIYRTERRKRAWKLVVAGWRNNQLNAARLGQEFHKHLPGFGVISRVFGGVGLPGR